MTDTFIILSADQASTVRGQSAETPTARLEPIALTDGTFALGIDVLDDPAHVLHREMLAALPTADIDAVKARMPHPSAAGA